MAISGIIPCSMKADITSDQAQKIYVKPNQISIKDECILVQLPDGLFGTMVLNKDNDGYYVLSSELLLAKVEAWPCPECYYMADSCAALNRHIRLRHRNGH